VPPSRTASPRALTVAALLVALLMGCGGEEAAAPEVAACAPAPAAVVAPAPEPTPKATGVPRPVPVRDARELRRLTASQAALVEALAAADEAAVAVVTEGHGSDAVGTHDAVAPGAIAVDRAPAADRPADRPAADRPAAAQPCAPAAEPAVGGH
jgi:hypothetical protein